MPSSEGSGCLGSPGKLDTGKDLCPAPGSRLGRRAVHSLGLTCVEENHGPSRTTWTSSDPGFPLDSGQDQFSHKPRHWVHKDGLNLLVKSCFLHPRQLWLGKNPSPLYLIYILELHLISIYKGVCEKDNVPLVESVSLKHLTQLISAD